MKALTIFQPWASLVIAGAKPYEFRKWRAPASMIGQRIVIHAAARKVDMIEAGDLFALLSLREKFPTQAAETCLIAERAIPVLNRLLQDRLPMAAGIGTAVIGEPRLGTRIAEDFGVPRANDSDRDQHANWGWPMLEIDPWPEPIPTRGMQGFWTWPEPAEFIGAPL
ncbi:ASCH domain-containing protein [Novosphingobium sp. CF614]|uniref:ASCH domain-containing protein n=1 Tax=Novosphingobium sp. CF614 TaxID=1884364 RepID=UPI0008E6B29D|nr:ASCH domain-containing protein [Novosphingobium sp. CF614]SFG09163.1 ASCH domain-containing protein [Novosphingobium sp. CF614]